MVGNKDTQQRKSCKSRTSRDMGILRHVKNFVLCCVSHSRIDTLITMIMSDPCDIVVLSSQPIRSQGLKALDQWACNLNMWLPYSEIWSVKMNHASTMLMNTFFAV